MNSELAQSQDSKGPSLTLQASSPRLETGYMGSHWKHGQRLTHAKYLPLLSEKSHSWFVGCLLVCVSVSVSVEDRKRRRREIQPQEHIGAWMALGHVHRLQPFWFTTEFNQWL